MNLLSVFIDRPHMKMFSKMFKTESVYNNLPSIKEEEKICELKTYASSQNTDQINAHLFKVKL